MFKTLYAPGHREQQYRSYNLTKYSSLNVTYVRADSRQLKKFADKSGEPCTWIIKSFTKKPQNVVRTARENHFHLLSVPRRLKIVCVQANLLKNKFAVRLNFTRLCTSYVQIWHEGSSVFLLFSRPSRVKERL